MCSMRCFWVVLALGLGSAVAAVSGPVGNHPDPRGWVPSKFQGPRHAHRQLGHHSASFFVEKAQKNAKFDGLSRGFRGLWGGRKTLGHFLGSTMEKNGKFIDSDRRSKLKNDSRSRKRKSKSNFSIPYKEAPYVNDGKLKLLSPNPELNVEPHFSGPNGKQNHDIFRGVRHTPLRWVQNSQYFPRSKFQTMRGFRPVPRAPSVHARRNTPSARKLPFRDKRQMKKFKPSFQLPASDETIEIQPNQNSPFVHPVPHKFISPKTSESDGFSLKIPSEGFNSKEIEFYKDDNSEPKGFIFGGEKSNFRSFIPSNPDAIDPGPSVERKNKGKSTKMVEISKPIPRVKTLSQMIHELGFDSDSHSFWNILDRSKSLLSSDGHTSSTTDSNGQNWIPVQNPKEEMDFAESNIQTTVDNFNLAHSIQPRSRRHNAIISEGFKVPKMEYGFTPMKVFTRPKESSLLSTLGEQLNSFQVLSSQNDTLNGEPTTIFPRRVETEDGDEGNHEMEGDLSEEDEKLHPKRAKHSHLSGLPSLPVSHIHSSDTASEHPFFQEIKPDETSYVKTSGAKFGSNDGRLTRTPLELTHVLRDKKSFRTRQKSDSENLQHLHPNYHRDVKSHDSNVRNNPFRERTKKLSQSKSIVMHLIPESVEEHHVLYPNPIRINHNDTDSGKTHFRFFHENSQVKPSRPESHGSKTYSADDVVKGQDFYGAQKSNYGRSEELYVSQEDEESSIDFLQLPRHSNEGRKKEIVDLEFGSLTTGPDRATEESRLHYDVAEHTRPSSKGIMPMKFWNSRWSTTAAKRTEKLQKKNHFKQNFAKSFQSNVQDGKIDANKTKVTSSSWKTFPSVFKNVTHSHSSKAEKLKNTLRKSLTEKELQRDKTHQKKQSTYEKFISSHTPKTGRKTASQGTNSGENDKSSSQKLQTRPKSVFFPPLPLADDSLSSTKLTSSYVSYNSQNNNFEVFRPRPGGNNLNTVGENQNALTPNSHANNVQSKIIHATTSTFRPTQPSSLRTSFPTILQTSVISQPLSVYSSPGQGNKTPSPSLQPMSQGYNPTGGNTGAGTYSGIVNARVPGGGSSSSTMYDGSAGGSNLGSPLGGSSITPSYGESLDGLGTHSSSNPGGSYSGSNSQSSIGTSNSMYGSTGRKPSVGVSGPGSSYSGASGLKNSALPYGGSNRGSSVRGTSNGSSYSGTSVGGGQGTVTRGSQRMPGVSTKDSTSYGGSNSGISAGSSNPESTYGAKNPGVPNGMQSYGQFNPGFQSPMNSLPSSLSFPSYLNSLPMSSLGVPQVSLSLPPNFGNIPLTYSSPNQPSGVRTKVPSNGLPTMNYGSPGATQGLPVGPPVTYTANVGENSSATPNYAFQQISQNAQPLVGGSTSNTYAGSNSGHLNAQISNDFVSPSLQNGQNQFSQTMYRSFKRPQSSSSTNAYVPNAAVGPPQNAISSLASNGRRPLDSHSGRKPFQTYEAPGSTTSAQIPGPVNFGRPSQSYSPPIVGRPSLSPRPVTFEAPSPSYAAPNAGGPSRGYGSTNNETPSQTYGVPNVQRPSQSSGFSNIGTPSQSYGSGNARIPSQGLGPLDIGALSQSYASTNAGSPSQGNIAVNLGTSQSYAPPTAGTSLSYEPPISGIFSQSLGSPAGGLLSQSYGAPPVGEPSPSYGAPPSGTPSPSYGAPSGTPSPSYGAPPSGTPSPSYGAPPIGASSSSNVAPPSETPSPSYRAPSVVASSPSYGAPPSRTPSPSYGTPPSGTPSSSLGALPVGAPSPSYGAPSSGTPSPSYGAPPVRAPSPSFGVPVSPTPSPPYGASPAGAPSPSYGAPPETTSLSYRIPSTGVASSSHGAPPSGTPSPTYRVPSSGVPSILNRTPTPRPVSQSYESPIAGIVPQSLGPPTLATPSLSYGSPNNRAPPQSYDTQNGGIPSQTYDSDSGLQLQSHGFPNQAFTGPSTPIRSSQSYSPTKTDISSQTYKHPFLGTLSLSYRLPNVGHPPSRLYGAGSAAQSYRLRTRDNFLQPSNFLSNSVPIPPHGFPNTASPLYLNAIDVRPHRPVSGAVLPLTRRFPKDRIAGYHSPNSPQFSSARSRDPYAYKNIGLSKNKVSPSFSEKPEQFSNAYSHPGSKIATYVTTPSSVYESDSFSNPLGTGDDTTIQSFTKNPYAGTSPSTLSSHFFDFTSVNSNVDTKLQAVSQETEYNPPRRESSESIFPQHRVRHKQSKRSGISIPLNDLRSPVSSNIAYKTTTALPKRKFPPAEAALPVSISPSLSEVPYSYLPTTRHSQSFRSNVPSPVTPYPALLSSSPSYLKSTHSDSFVNEFRHHRSLLALRHRGTKAPDLNKGSVEFPSSSNDFSDSPLTKIPSLISDSLNKKVRNSPASANTINAAHHATTYRPRHRIVGSSANKIIRPTAPHSRKRKRIRVKKFRKVVSDEFRSHETQTIRSAAGRPLSKLNSGEEVRAHPRPNLKWQNSANQVYRPSRVNAESQSHESTGNRFKNSKERRKSD